MKATRIATTFAVVPLGSAFWIDGMKFLRMEDRYGINAVRLDTGTQHKISNDQEVDMKDGVVRVLVEIEENVPYLVDELGKAVIEATKDE